MFLTIPTLLTWTRIAAIPLLISVFGWDADVHRQNQWATGFFVGFALTDWLDGYLARRLNQTSAFGAFLDPVADKFWVCAALLVLVDLHRVQLWVAFVIIGREMAVLALREWMAQMGASQHLAVHMLGKFKTAAQMVAIAFLLFNDPFWGVDTAKLGTLLIDLSAFLTIWSMAYYLRKALPEIRQRVRPVAQKNEQSGTHD
jgi:cardiolipin synthase